MNLKEFVQASLVDIVTALKDADAQITEAGGMLNPGRRAIPGLTVPKEVGLVPVQEVEFDVAVTASQTRGAEGKAGSRR